MTHDDVPRVEGVLAVTRAFGNNAMKAVINAEPEVVAHRLAPSDEFLIIASDGVWDMVSNEDAVRGRVAALCRALRGLLATRATNMLVKTQR